MQNAAFCVGSDMMSFVELNNGKRSVLVTWTNGLLYGLASSNDSFCIKQRKDIEANKKPGNTIKIIQKKGNKLLLNSTRYINHGKNVG